MKKYFLTGLVTLLPLAVTIWVVQIVVNFLTKPFIDIVMLLTDKIPVASPQLIRTLSQIIILIALFIFILFLGFVARKFFFGQLLKLSDYLLIKIPLVNKIYKTSKEIVKTLLGSKQGSFKQVVMIHFPYQGCFCIGLVSRDAPKTCSDQMEDPLVSVFIPTTPNPTTGFLVMSKKSELIFLSMKSEEAIKYIVSCGVIQPEEKP